MFLLRPLHLAIGAASPAPPPPSGPPTLNAALRGGTFGDSRVDFKGGGSTGPDLNDKNTASPSQGNSYSITPACACYTEFMDDLEMVANGGCSGESTSSWNGTRLGGRTPAAIVALAPHFVVFQYATNDSINYPVNSAASSIAAADAAIVNYKAAITYFLNAGIKVIFETTYQRTAAGYANAFTTERRDYTDRVNTQMLAWVLAHTQYGTNLKESDVRSITQVGGALTGAFLDPAVSSDGTHLHRAGAQKVAKATTAAIRALFGDSGPQSLLGTTGANLITVLDATTVLGLATSNCTVVQTFGTDSLGRYVNFVGTPSGVGLPTMSVQIHANVGSNGGATPPNTLTAGQAIKGRLRVTLDDNAGGPPPVNNLYVYRYTQYVGGTPSLETCQQGAAGAGTQQYSEAQVQAAYITQPAVLAGSSSQIAAPSAGAGMRYQLGLYGTSTTAQFRLRVHVPEIRVFA